MRLSEVNHELYWLPRLPNTLGWLHSEMFDTEEALRHNNEGSAISWSLPAYAAGHQRTDFHVLP